MNLLVCCLLMLTPTPEHLFSVRWQPLNAERSADGPGIQAHTTKLAAVRAPKCEGVILQGGC